MRCALCEQDLTAGEAIRFSNTNPPRSARYWFSSGSVAAITALGDGFTAVIRAAMGEPQLTYWFHRDCWKAFSKDLLNDG